MSHDITLGNLIQDAGHKDAIHIAIAPVVAACNLLPGEHIGFIKKGDTTKVGNYSDNPIGIVDPFLTEPVKKNQHFYMCLYPKSITSLRHDWDHPAFVADKSESEQWLENFASEVELSYEELLEAADSYIRTGDYHVCQGFDTPNIVYQESTNFWKHYQTVTGKVLPEDMGMFFTCSC